MKCKCPHCEGEINISIFLNREVQRQEDAPKLVSPTLQAIAEVVCNNAGITLIDFRRKERKRQYVKPRQQYMWLAKRYSGATLLEIGSFIRPECDHTTVIHGIKSIDDLIFSSSQEKLEMDFLAGIISEMVTVKAAV
jgi:chromosomal replication initiation ATPase DnaA